jgi:cell division protein FtsB
MREIGIQFFAGKPLQVILHGDALAQRFVHLQRQRAAQQGLAEQQQGQVMRRIHVEVEQQRELFEGGMRQQLGFVADENRSRVGMPRSPP